MTRAVLNTLKKARARITDRKNWGKHSYGAVDSAEGPVCASGAVWFATKDDGCDVRVERVLQALIPTTYVSEYNDAKSTKHEDVLTMFDWAIGITEAGGL